MLRLQQMLLPCLSEPLRPPGLYLSAISTLESVPPGLSACGLEFEHEACLSVPELPVILDLIFE